MDDLFCSISVDVCIGMFSARFSVEQRQDLSIWSLLQLARNGEPRWQLMNGGLASRRRLKEGYSCHRDLWLVELTYKTIRIRSSRRRRTTAVKNHKRRILILRALYLIRTPHRTRIHKEENQAGWCSIRYASKATFALAQHTVRSWRPASQYVLRFYIYSGKSSPITQS